MRPSIYKTKDTVKNEVNQHCQIFRYSMLSLRPYLDDDLPKKINYK